MPFRVLEGHSVNVPVGIFLGRGVYDILCISMGPVTPNWSGACVESKSVICLDWNPQQSLVVGRIPILSRYSLRSSLFLAGRGSRCPLPGEEGGG